MKKTVFIAFVASCFVTSAFADQYLKVYIQNNSQHQMTISAKWKSSGTTCSVTYNNDPISVNVKGNPLKANSNCGNGKTIVTFQGSYDLYDASGNWLTNCTFIGSGAPYPGDLWSGFQSSWSSVNYSYTCNPSSSPIQVKSSKDGASITFTVSQKAS